MAYPAKLLDEVASFLFTQFQQLGLVMWAARPTAGGLWLTKLLNDAWEEFETRPETFALFEREHVEALKKAFGL